MHDDLACETELLTEYKFQWTQFCKHINIYVYSQYMHNDMKESDNDVALLLYYMTYLTSACTPQINAAAQSNGQYILRWPIDQIQIEIVLQFGRVQHFEGNAWNFARRFPWWS